MKELGEVLEKLRLLLTRLDSVIVGQQAVKEQIIVSLLTGGHVLLEGVPGTGKTLLGLTISRLLGCRFKRIQFTPDLMPVDLLGTNIFNPKTQSFEFHAGPVFTDILLADEINRTPPRTQSALLESMQEKAATIDGARHEISKLFFVIATQNPVEFEGTYQLPEAQRDRFLMKITIDYPMEQEEQSILEAYASGRRLHDQVLFSIEPVFSIEDVILAKNLISQIRVEKGIFKYITDVVRMTRNDDSIQLGAGPRASIALLEASRSLAAIRGRDFITPDDVKELAKPTLAHRIILSPEAEMEGLAIEDVLRRIFEKVEVPR